jgi:hypothetical protein
LLRTDFINSSSLVSFSLVALFFAIAYDLSIVITH